MIQAESKTSIAKHVTLTVLLIFGSAVIVRLPHRPQDVQESGG